MPHALKPASMSRPPNAPPPGPKQPPSADDWAPTQRVTATERFAPTERVASLDRYTPTERLMPPETFPATERFVRAEPWAPTQRVEPGASKPAAPAATPGYEPTQRYEPSQRYEPTQRFQPETPAAVAAAPAAGNALPLGTQLAEFEVVRVLGEGGFGVVYLAHDHSLRREVAIKEYMPAALATRKDGQQVQFASERNRAVFGAGLISFINEARLLAKFDHPSLVKVYRFWQANGTAYMVMPFYEGATLKDTLLKLGGPPDERWLLAFLGALTEALGVIHADHFLHRDIAPDNILLLSGSGRPLLLDFGAARQVIGDATQALTAILKPGFAPVEQYAEAPGMRQGPWTDIYALCAVVYTAITGRKPPVSVGRTVRDNYVPLVRSAAGQYSERFLAAIDAGLLIQPTERPQSVADLRQALGLDAPGAAFNAPMVSQRPPMAAPAGPTPMPEVPRERPMAPAAAQQRAEAAQDLPRAAAPAPVRGALPRPHDPYAPATARPDIPSVRPAARAPQAPAAVPRATERNYALRWLLGWLAVAGLAAAVAGAFMWSVYVRPVPSATSSTAPVANPAPGGTLAVPPAPSPTGASAASPG